jgi:hypothetical protein
MALIEHLHPFIVRQRQLVIGLEILGKTMFANEIALQIDADVDITEQGLSSCDNAQEIREHAPGELRLSQLDAVAEVIIIALPLHCAGLNWRGGRQYTLFPSENKTPGITGFAPYGPIL